SYAITTHYTPFIVQTKSFLFSIMRTPPTSTLFPYTTLFRSETRRVKPGRAHADRDPPPSDRALGSYVAVPRPSRPPRPGSENQVMESTSVPPRPRGRVKLAHPLYTPLATHARHPSQRADPRRA